MARIDFCKERLVHKERTRIPLFSYSFFISTLRNAFSNSSLHLRRHFYAGGFQPWMERLLWQLRLCAHKGHAQVMLWRVIRSLLRGAYNFYLRSWWAWTPCRVLARGPFHEGCKADSCNVLFLQREHCANPEKNTVRSDVGRLSSYHLENCLDLVAWDWCLERLNLEQKLDRAKE